MAVRNLPVVEQLEPRIAPAAVVLTNGANLLSAGDQGYLSDGESEGSATLLAKVTSGKALVFWDSESRQIKGISVSDKTNIEILGNVDGDIVTNLLPSGYLTDSDNNPSNGLDGGRLLPHSISGIKTTAYIDGKGIGQNGDVGRIIAGGSISKIELDGDLSGVYAGDGIFDAIETAASSEPVDGLPSTSFLFTIGFAWDNSGPLSKATSMTLDMADATLLGGASISGVTFASGENVQFFAGDGLGSDANGGSISNVRFVGAIAEADVTAGFFEGRSYSMMAGNGINNSAGNGGNGGGIQGVSEIASTGNPYIAGGHGGDALSAKGKGGAGGAIGNMDLQGSALTYAILTGDGGNGISGGHAGAVSNINISSQGTISLAAPFMGGSDFFVIDRGSGEMTVIDGETLKLGSSPIVPLASGVVDAIVTDLNTDGKPDVVIAYSDKSLGILINNGVTQIVTDEGLIDHVTFTYTVKDLGFKPTAVLSGDFLDDGGEPELAILSTNKVVTTLRLYSANDPTIADSFVSDIALFKPLSIKKGTLVDAIGGTSPAGVHLMLRPIFDQFPPVPLRSDLVMGFADGTLQGVFSTGAGTLESPFAFALEAFDLTAPTVRLAGGIKSLDFNFGGTEAEGVSSQAIAVVNASGSGASVVTIALPPPPEPVEGENPEPEPAPEPEPEEPDEFAFIPGPAIPLLAGYGRVMDAKWISTSISLSPPYPSLAVLTSDSTSSGLVLYEGGEDGAMSPRMSYTGDSLRNSISSNFLYAGVSTSIALTTGNATNLFVYQGILPLELEEDEALEFSNVSLPFSPKLAAILTGEGGEGTAGIGGNGGEIRSINIDSNFALLATGSGGSSSQGSGGHGGSFINSASFRSDGNVIRPSIGVTNELLVELGDGADALNTVKKSKGGNGGTVSGLTVSYSGLSVEIIGGDGGDSQGLAAGNGGSVGLTIFNGSFVALTAGNGGEGLTGATASGGHGGNVSIVAGQVDEDKVVTRFLRGDILALAGVGGNSAAGRGGNGGSITSSRVQNMLSPATQLELQAGNGGASSGSSDKAAGGDGGSISSFKFVAEKDSNIQPSLIAGHGGGAVGGSGGAGGGLQNISLTGGIVNLSSGDGGSTNGMSAKNTGGAGGTITGITVDVKGSGYMSIESGSGGQGVGAAGGAGGLISRISLKLNPDGASVGDETLGVTIQSGAGGTGSKGGQGGLITGVQSTGIFDNYVKDGLVTLIDSIAMRFIGGNGGSGLVTEGGSGGTVAFSNPLLGISQIDKESTNPDFQHEDEALRVIAGMGGSGITKGGVGGSVIGVRVFNGANSQGETIPINIFGSAFLNAGNGGTATSGEGGAGGSVSNAQLAVERSDSADLTGNLRVLSGSGGLSSGGKGGNGGSVSGSSFTSVNGNNDEGYALLIQSGAGGAGAMGGGTGGSLSKFVAMTSAGVNGTSPTIYGSVIIAGDGGQGLSGSVGGMGGSISGITQPKEPFSAINLIQAGSGGNGGTGGAGGSIANIKSVGYLGASFANGLPQGLFNSVATSTLINSLTTEPHLHQGVFAGIGGTGSVRGINGSVTSISAPAIAAMGAANLSGVFENASLMTKISTLFLAYDIAGDGAYQEGDGFVLADQFDIQKELKSLDLELVPTTQLISRTGPFVNP